MAKNKIGKGVGARDTGTMSKSDLRAYNKEINEFYESNGWRTTLSQYLLSPLQAGEIVKKTRERMAKEAAKVKAAKVKARAAKKGAKAQAKPPAKKKAPPRASSKKAAKPPAAPKKKPKAPKAPKPAKAPKAPKPAKTPKAPGKKKFVKSKAKLPKASAVDESAILDYLLAYRKGVKDFVSLDTVIADLATRVRAA